MMHSKRLSPMQSRRSNWSRNLNLLRKHRSGEGRPVEGRPIVEAHLHEGRPGAVDPPLENRSNQNGEKKRHLVLHLLE